MGAKDNERICLLATIPMVDTQKLMKGHDKTKESKDCKWLMVNF